MKRTLVVLTFLLSASLVESSEIEFNLAFNDLNNEVQLTETSSAALFEPCFVTEYWRLTVYHGHCEELEFEGSTVSNQTPETMGEVWSLYLDSEYWTIYTMTKTYPCD